MAIRFRLKRFLAMREMTQKQLSEITGIRPPTISAICTNSIKQIPTVVMDKICEALDCQPSDWIERVTSEPKNSSND